MIFPLACLPRQHESPVETVRAQLLAPEGNLPVFGAKVSRSHRFIKVGHYPVRIHTAGLNVLFTWEASALIIPCLCPSSKADFPLVQLPTNTFKHLAFVCTGNITTDFAVDTRFNLLCLRSAAMETRHLDKLANLARLRWESVSNFGAFVKSNIDKIGKKQRTNSWQW